MIKEKTQHLLSADCFALYLYLFLAWSLAIAQPLMALFGEQPVFLIAHEIRGWSLIVATLVLNFLPAFLLLLVCCASGMISKKLKEWLARLILWFLLALFILTLVSNYSYKTALVFALVCSALMVFLLIKIEAVKTFAKWLAPTGLIFIVVFLFYSPASQLISYQKTVTANGKTNTNGAVFVFVLDEFPLLSLLKAKEEIDESRFPTFAMLAKEATWYPNATAISNSTELVIPAILTGIKPSTTGKRLGTYQQYPDNLFTILSNSHRVHAVENTSRMCPPYLCKSQLKEPYQLLFEDVLVSYLYQIFPQDKKELLPPINDKWLGYLRELKNEEMKTFDFSERLNKFDDFIDDFAIYPQNTFHFLHILLPHAPWRILPDLKLYGFYEHDGIPGELDKDNPFVKTAFSHEWTNDQWATQLGWRRHLLQVGGVDNLLKKALDKIKKLGLYENSTIVVVADHGSAFKPGLSRRYAHDDNVADIVGVPLFIKYPHQTEGRIDLRLASNLDILPTLMETHGYDKTPIELDGISLVGNKKRSQAEIMIQEDKSTWRQLDNYNSLFEKSLARKNELFPNSGWFGVYHPKGSADFYHKNISSLIIKKTHKNTIKLMNANLFEKFDPNSRYVPVYYRFKYVIEQHAIKEVLVAVNNKIVSHCYLFVHAKDDCAGLIDPKDYKIGNQDEFINMRFFAVLEKTNETYIVDELLQELRSKAKLIVQKNKSFIQFNNGEKLNINLKATPFGEATLKLVDDGTNYQIDGWAGNSLTGQVAKKIYLFIDNQLYTTIETGIKKNYVYLRYGFKTLLDSGFQINIPITEFPEIKLQTLRVIAKTHTGEFVELNYHADKVNPELLDVFKPFTNKAIPINDSEVLALKIQYLQNENVLNKTVFDAFDKDFSEISIGQWFAIKKHARWIGSSIIFAIPNQKKFKVLKIQITAKPLLYKELVKQQRVLVTVNGKLVNELMFIKKETKEISLDVSAHDTSKPLVVKFEMPDAVAPSSIRDSQDSRLLSLYVTDFKVSLIQESL